MDSGGESLLGRTNLAKPELGALTPLQAAHPRGRGLRPRDRGAVFAKTNCAGSWPFFEGELELSFSRASLAAGAKNWRLIAQSLSESRSIVVFKRNWLRVGEKIAANREGPLLGHLL